MKEVIRAFTRRMGYEIRKVGPGGTPNLMHFLKSRNIDVVFDVGANVGQFGRQIRDCGYEGQIVSFEPVQTVFAKLKTIVDGDKKWEAHNVALGSNVGRATINVSESSIFSSMLEQTNVTLRFDSAAAVQRREDVQVARLSDYIERFDSKKIFLKIDTQGFERQVLEGGNATLSSIIGIQLELPIVHLYRDNWSFNAAVEYMTGIGFVICQMHPVNYHSEDPVSVLEFDCLFRRFGKIDE